MTMTDYDNLSSKAQQTMAVMKELKRTVRLLIPICLRVLLMVQILYEMNAGGGILVVIERTQKYKVRTCAIDVRARIYR